MPSAMVYNPAKTLYPRAANASSVRLSPAIGTLNTVINSLPSSCCRGFAFSGASRSTSTRTSATVSFESPGDSGNAGVMAGTPTLAAESVSPFRTLPPRSPVASSPPATVPTYPVSSFNSRSAATIGSSSASTNPAGSSIVSPFIGGRNCRTSRVVSSSPFFRSVANTHTASMPLDFADSDRVARPTMSHRRVAPVGSRYVRLRNSSHGVACLTSTSITLDLDEQRSSAILDAGVEPSRSSTYTGPPSWGDSPDEEARGVCMRDARVGARGRGAVGESARRSSEPARI